MDRECNDSQMPPWKTVTYFNHYKKMAETNPLILNQFLRRSESNTIF